MRTMFVSKRYADSLAFQNVSKRDLCLAFPRIAYISSRTMYKCQQQVDLGNIDVARNYMGIIFYAKDSILGCVNVDTYKRTATNQ